MMLILILLAMLLLPDAVVLLLLVASRWLNFFIMEQSRLRHVRRHAGLEGFKSNVATVRHTQIQQHALQLLQKDV